MLNAATATPRELEAHGLVVNRDGARRSAFELAAQAQFPLSTLTRVWPQLANVPAILVRRLESDAKYSVYLNRQAEDVARYRRDNSAVLPVDLDYARLSGLSNEIKQKFIAVRPVSLGQARRIEGVTPAALALIAAHARRAERSAGRDRLPAGREPGPPDGVTFVIPDVRNAADRESRAPLIRLLTRRCAPNVPRHGRVDPRIKSGDSHDGKPKVDNANGANTERYKSRQMIAENRKTD